VIEDSMNFLLVHVSALTPTITDVYEMPIKFQSGFCKIFFKKYQISCSQDTKADQKNTVHFVPYLHHTLGIKEKARNSFEMINRRLI
jgi:hypothetical protein